MYPKISVITPSYNQGQFIENTIKSVIYQNYPNLEYILIDGESNDETKNIIEEYVNYFAYFVSESDKGQANAINKGFQKADGDIICWLNSDDLFEPNALWTVANYFMKNQSNFLYGDGWIFYDERKFRPKKIYWKSEVESINTLTYFDPIQQPSAFWTRKVFDEVGFLNESLNYALDWDYFIRISQKFELHYIPIALSSYRIHKSHKTSSGGLERLKEIMTIVEKYSSPEWINIYATLYPYYSEIKLLQKIFRRFYKIPFTIKHPSIFFSHDLKKLKIAIKML
jgi:glycosyltransferase involved in cell wall biosynthesis